jgi:hypothetical protein
LSKRPSLVNNIFILVGNKKLVPALAIVAARAHNPMPLFELPDRKMPYSRQVD